MKVALAHELLTMKGGAERVVRSLAGMFPDATVSTFLYDRKAMGDWFDPTRIRTSRIQYRAGPLSVVIGKKAFWHQYYLPLFPGAVEALTFPGDIDVLVSSSSAYMHGAIAPKGAAHVCYVHSPARYLWDEEASMLARYRGVRGWPVRAFAGRLFHRHRIWDATAADRPDVLVAASNVVRRRIQLYWGRESTVVYPFADDEWFVHSPKPAATPEGPFVVVANLRTYKGIERAVDAAKATESALIIVGDGPARPMLERRSAATNVRFVGRKEGDDLRALYVGARALVVPGTEDFGINAVEALACGTPIIAPTGSGTVEIFEDDVTGVVAASTSAADLAEAMRAQSLGRMSPAACRTRAERFTRAVFEQQMYSIVEAAIAARAKASR